MLRVMEKIEEMNVSSLNLPCFTPIPISLLIPILSLYIEALRAFTGTIPIEQLLEYFYEAFPSTNG